MGALERMYQTYKDRVDFKIVYVREAHPADGWRVQQNDRAGIVVNEPRTLEERIAVARKCADELNISIKIVIDGMDDAVEKAYAGWPDRIYIVDAHGKIAYKGDPGPRGFRPPGSGAGAETDSRAIEGLSSSDVELGQHEL